MRPWARIAGITTLAMAAPANAALLMLDPATGAALFQGDAAPTWAIYQAGDHPPGGIGPPPATSFPTPSELAARTSRPRFPPPSEAPEIAAGATETRRSGSWVPLIVGILLVAYRMRSTRGRTRFTSAV